MLHSLLLLVDHLDGAGCSDASDKREDQGGPIVRQTLLRTKMLCEVDAAKRLDVDGAWRFSTTPLSLPVATVTNRPKSAGGTGESRSLACLVDHKSELESGSPLHVAVSGSERSHARVTARSAPTCAAKVPRLGAVGDYIIPTPQQPCSRSAKHRRRRKARARPITRARLEMQ